STLATPAGVPEVVKGELAERAEVLGAVLFAIDRAQIVARPIDGDIRPARPGPAPDILPGIAGLRARAAAETPAENRPERGGLAS
ncbi:MAG: hypothetical protein ABWY68_03955, partial [Cryobacterium sp.]